MKLLFLFVYFFFFFLRPSASAVTTETVYLVSDNRLMTKVAKIEKMKQTVTQTRWTMPAANRATPSASTNCQRVDNISYTGIHLNLGARLNVAHLKKIVLKSH